MKLGDTKWVYKQSYDDKPMWPCMGNTPVHFGIGRDIDIAFNLNRGELLMLYLVEEMLR